MQRSETVDSTNKGPSSLAEHMQQLCCSDVDADVYFICMDDDQQVRIPGHKYILSLRSAVMRSMFYGSLPESNEVEIADIPAEVFRHLLKFMYLDKIDIPIALAPKLLYAAKKYMLFHLVDKVGALMTTHLKSQGSKAGSLLMLQNLMEFVEIESATFENCLQVIEADAATLLQSDEFCQLKEATVSIIIQREKLQIPEKTLYRCLLKWSAQECKRRGLAEGVESHRIVLDQLIHHIRFTTFSETQLSQLMDECRVLDGDLIADLLVGCSNAQVKKSITFFDNKPPRIGKMCRRCKHIYHENAPKYYCQDKNGGTCQCFCRNYDHILL